MHNEYKKYLSSNLMNQAFVPTGVKEMINFLESKGFALGLVTSQPQYRMIEMLRVSGLENRFTAMIHWGDTVRRKPYAEPIVKALNILKVKPEEAIYVGDDLLDIECARNAKVTDMLALWASSYLLDELLTFNPTYLLTSPDRICFLNLAFDH